MKFLIAPCAYKGTFSPLEVCRAIERGIRRTVPGAKIDSIPIADGGDGTIESVYTSIGGLIETLEVEDPIGRPVLAKWLRLTAVDELDDQEATLKGTRKSRDVVLKAVGGPIRDASSREIAIVELASASGIAHLKMHELAPLDANTVGTGQLLRHISLRGFQEIILTVGGSASTDGGTGILDQLGVLFLDRAGQRLEPGGRSLSAIAEIDLLGMGEWSIGRKIKIATDVTNPLCGPEGAAYVFARQKGANSHDVEVLDSGLYNFADILETTTRVQARNLPGAGAAGGVPFGLVCTTGATIISGFQWLSDLVGLEKRVAFADVVITGEGRLDDQSLKGKAVGELAKMCAKHGKKLWAVPAIADVSVTMRELMIDRIRETRGPRGNASLDDITLAVVDMLKAGR